ncbi:MAG: aldehyde dehydrogenase family protein [Bacteroidota bacterium]
MREHIIGKNWFYTTRNFHSLKEHDMEQTGTIPNPPMTAAEKLYTLKNYINGSWIDSTGTKTVPNINPADTRMVLCATPLSSRDDAKHAIASAKEAFPGWKATPPPKRGKILFNAVRLMEERLEHLATTLTKEEGKIISESRGEVQRSINIVEFTAGEGRRLRGATIPSELLNTFIYTIRQPIGVVGIITPWNFPVAIPIWKIAPALLAGNTVVFKPATFTPLCAVEIVKIFEESGLPKGVLNLVMGSGNLVGDEIVNNPDVHAISFTGSTDVGLSLYGAASSHGMRVQCEMGGKNPLIILEDADLNLALEGAMSGGFGSTGQRCTASSRVIVVDAIADKFTEMMLARMETYRVGNGLDPQTEMGPSIDEAQMNSVLNYIDVGKAEGARLLKGGTRLISGNYKNGYYVQPTLFDGVKMNMRIAQEEIFGPVIALIRVKNFEEAVHAANDVKYGLSASLYTNDVSKILRFVEMAEVGKVHINNPPVGGEAQAPFGGIKATGVGPREQGSEVFEFYTELKTIYLDYTGKKRATNIY